MTPKRTAGGYRVYDDADVRLLRAMKVLVLAGWSTRAAAERVMTVGDLPLEGGLGAEQVLDPSEGVSILSQLASEADPVGIDEVLDREFDRAPFEVIADAWLLPALAELGSASQAGRVIGASDELVTEAVSSRVSAIFEASRATDEGPLILTGLPGSDKHELGMLCLATLLRRAGANGRYLGGDLPTRGWVDSVTKSRATAIVMGVATMSDVIAARDAVNGLKAKSPNLWVYAAGGAQASVHVAARPVGHNLLAAADALMSDLGILAAGPTD